MAAANLILICFRSELIEDGRRRRVTDTTGNSQIPVCQNLCRVLKHGHTANRTFAVCQKKQHTAKVQLTAIILFAVCPPKKHTAKAQHTANMCVCRVLKKDAHGKPLAHGKEPLFAVCLLYCTRQTSGTRQNCAKKSRHNTPNFFFYAYTVYCTPF